MFIATPDGPYVSEIFPHPLFFSPPLFPISSTRRRMLLRPAAPSCSRGTPLSSSPAAAERPSSMRSGGRAATTRSPAEATSARARQPHHISASSTASPLAPRRPPHPTSGRAAPVPGLVGPASSLACARRPGTSALHYGGELPRWRRHSRLDRGRPQKRPAGHAPVAPLQPHLSRRPKELGQHRAAPPPPQSSAIT